jgi:hypothetical protein
VCAREINAVPACKLKSRSPLRGLTSEFRSLAVG